MRIQSGKYYRTRSGRKVKIYEILRDTVVGIVYKDELGNPEILTQWGVTGTHTLKLDELLKDVGPATSLDLIQEWREDPKVFKTVVHFTVSQDGTFVRTEEALSKLEEDKNRILNVFRGKRVVGRCDYFEVVDGV